MTKKPGMFNAVAVWSLVAYGCGLGIVALLFGWPGFAGALVFAAVEYHVEKATTPDTPERPPGPPKAPMGGVA